MKHCHLSFLLVPPDQATGHQLDFLSGAPHSSPVPKWTVCLQPAGSAGVSNGLSGGRYIDRFEKRNDVWKIAARACLIEWSGALGDIVVPEVFAKAYAETGTSSRDRSDLSYMRPLKIARPSKADPF